MINGLNKISMLLAASENLHFDEGRWHPAPAPEEALAPPKKRVRFADVQNLPERPDSLSNGAGTMPQRADPAHRRPLPRPPEQGIFYTELNAWVRTAPADELMSRQAAATQLANAFRCKAPVLNLSNLNLTSLPVGMWKMRSLEHLYLDGNCLTSLPALPLGLITLRVQSNELTALPDLSKELVMLSAQDNNLLHCPRISEKLEYLAIHGNAHIDIPTFILDSGLNLLHDMERIENRVSEVRYWQQCDPGLSINAHRQAAFSHWQSCRQQPATLAHTTPQLIVNAHAEICGVLYPPPRA